MSLTKSIQPVKLTENRKIFHIIEGGKLLKKILVCITPQANGKRLIKKASEIANSVDGELHILHVEKGNNIFLTEESPKLLEELYALGSELGGILHGLCGEDIPKTILNFIKKEKISHVVLGMPPDDLKIKSEVINEKLKAKLPYLEITVIPR